MANVGHLICPSRVLRHGQVERSTRWREPRGRSRAVGASRRHPALTVCLAPCRACPPPGCHLDYPFADVGREDMSQSRLPVPHRLQSRGACPEISVFTGKRAAISLAAFTPPPVPWLGTHRHSFPLNVRLTCDINFHIQFPRSFDHEEMRPAVRLVSQAAGCAICARARDAEDRTLRNASRARC